MTFKLNGLPFILFLGGLTAVSPLSIDMALPAFPQIEHDLAASAESIAYSVSIFLVGFALGPLVLGPLSDKFGRRPLLLIGFLIFALAGLGCALSTTTGQLLACRLAQGIGAGAGGILPFVIVRDLFEGHAARMRMSAITTVLGVGPIVAPLVGAAILSLIDWRGIFWVLTVCGILLLACGWLLFAESHPEHRRHPASVVTMIVSYRAVLTHAEFVKYTLINAAGFASMFAYIAGSPSVLMGTLGASRQTYSLLFACSAAAFMVGSTANGLIVRKTGTSRLPLVLAALALLVGGGGIFGLSLGGWLGQISFAACAALANFGCGLLAPSTIHDALQSMGKLSGVASAAFRFVQMVVAAGASALVGLLSHGHPALGLGLVMLAVAIMALLITLSTRHTHTDAPVGTSA